MLVCNVSLRAARRAISVGIAEVATAVDATATGNVVFATLVDDPANVGDRVDAYLGEIMLEAASADATVNAGLVYTVGLLEEAVAGDALSGAVPTILTADVAEAATAASTQDGTVAAPSRSAMLPKAYVNPSTSREAQVIGTMVNL